MTPTYLFYDLETSGLNPYFDQVLTFAAIRTDLNLNELDRYSQTLRLRSDIVPSPGAFITHRLMPRDLDGGSTEYEAACAIHEIINTPGTISLGYNTLGFDDNFLRFMFYRNLLDPYTHQYANGCRRMDLLPIATLYRVFKPEVIQWPQVDGSPSLKLELISELNRLVTSGRAHDAMTDVEATLALARLLKQEENIWAYCCGFFDKKEDQARQKKFPASGVMDEVGKSFPMALMVSMEMGKASMYVAPVIGIGGSIPYRNQSLWLRMDQDILPESGTLNVEEQFAIRKKHGESPFLLPPLDRFWDRLPRDQKIRQQQGIDKNLKQIHQEGDRRKLFQSLVQYHREFEYPVVPHVDSDASLYQASFFTLQEKKEMARFHGGTVADKVSFVSSSALSSRVKEMAERILFRNCPEDCLTPDLIKTRNAYLKKVFCCIGSNGEPSQIIGYKNDPRLTPQKALESLQALKSGGKDTMSGNGSNGDGKESTKRELDDEQKEILKWLEGYLYSLMG